MIIDFHKIINTFVTSLKIFNYFILFSICMCVFVCVRIHVASNLSHRIYTGCLYMLTYSFKIKSLLTGMVTQAIGPSTGEADRPMGLRLSWAIQYIPR